MPEKPTFWRLVPEWLWWVLGGAVVLGLLVMTPTAKQWHETSGLPQERATVVHKTTDAGAGCGKGAGPKHDIDWHSAHPPPGLPADFGELRSCRLVSVGQTHRVVRVPDSSGNPVRATVVVDPPRSLGNVLAAGSVGAVGGAVCGLLFFGLRRFQGWLVRRRLSRSAAR